jgi:hypothetical protein
MTTRPSFWFVDERHDNRIEAVRDVEPQFVTLALPQALADKREFAQEEWEDFVYACLSLWFTELGRRFPAIRVSSLPMETLESLQDGSTSRPSVLYRHPFSKRDVLMPISNWSVADLTQQRTLGKKLMGLLFPSAPVPEPLPHQASLIRYMRERPGWNTMLLMWTMGSGKTRAAGYVAELLADAEATHIDHVVILAHKTNLGNWEATMKDMRHARGALRFTIVGHAEYAQQAENIDHSRALVVVDESQHFRSLTPAMQYSVERLRTARHLLCLSGTPLVNGAEDMAGFLALVCGWQVDRAKAWAAKVAQQGAVDVAPPEVADACRGRVSFYDPAVHTPDLFLKHYPVVDEVDVQVPLTWHQAVMHQLEECSTITILGGKLLPLPTNNSYHTHTKQILVTGSSVSDLRGASDEVLQSIEDESPKIVALLRNLEVHFPEPQVVHSHFVEFGALQVFAILRWRHPEWRVEMITGATSAEERTRLVQDFGSRTSTPPIHVLIITDASATGTDVRGARAMHKLGRASNISTERQINGRCARYGSHEPGGKLTIYNYIATMRGKTGDETEAMDVAVEEITRIAYHSRKGIHKALVRAEETDREQLGRELMRALGLYDEGTQTYEEHLHVDNMRKQQQLDVLLKVIREQSVT